MVGGCNPCIFGENTVKYSPLYYNVPPYMGIGYCASPLGASSSPTKFQPNSCNSWKVDFFTAVSRLLNPILDRGPHEAPLGLFACHCQRAGDSKLKLPDFEHTLIADILWNFGLQVRSSQPSPGPICWTSRKNRKRPIVMAMAIAMHSYSSRSISMKLTGLHEVISTF